MKINNLEYNFVCDLIYFEGSFLSLFQREEQCYLFSWFDCDDLSNSWAIVDLSKDDLKDYLNQKITLRKIFQSSKEIVIFSKSKDEIKIKEVIGFNDLPIDTIPNDDSFLYDDISTPEAEKLAQGEAVCLFSLPNKKVDLFSLSNKKSVSSFSFSPIKFKQTDYSKLELGFANNEYNGAIKQLLGKNYEQEMLMMKDAVKNCDLTQDYMPSNPMVTIDVNDDSPIISLFAKNFSGKKKRDDFMMLVVGQRSFSSLSIFFGIRIYDFALRKKENLIDMLSGFIEKFGCKMNVNGKEYVIFSDIKCNGFNWNPKPMVENNILFEFEKVVDSVSFFLSFAVNTKKYLQSLKKHNYKMKKISYG